MERRRLFTVWSGGVALAVLVQLVGSAVAGGRAPAATIRFTDLAGKRITQASYGERIRIVTNRGVVCVRTSSGSAGSYCSHFTPRALRRRVNPHIVFDGLIRATSYDPRSPYVNRRVLARASLPVR